MSRLLANLVDSIKPDITQPQPIQPPPIQHSVPPPPPPPVEVNVLEEDSETQDTSEVRDLITMRVQVGEHLRYRLCREKI